MSLSQSIKDVLTASGGPVNGLVDGRFFRVSAPQGTARPYLVSQLITNPSAVTHGKSDDNEDTLAEARVQFTAVADDAEQAEEVITAVKNAFTDPTITECRDILAASRIVVTDPDSRELEPVEDAASETVFSHQLDLTFFHNPKS